MGKTAIILGGTGLVGGLLLNKLLLDDSYSTIKLFSRSSAKLSNPKIEEHLGDIIHLEDFKNRFHADEVFCCIGTTKAKTNDEVLYKQIDYGIPTKAAALCKENNIPFFAVVSALGANKNSTIFYNKTKGEMEEEVLRYQVKNTYILRPSLISGNRQEKRFLEDLSNVFMKLVNPLLVGSIKKYRSIPAKTIAECMYKLASEKPQITILSSEEIKAIVKRA
ncbi:NAD(P)H-binding protein [Tenacibaculum geojense]|uniref:NAD(P)H-binding protein n=1 Tax=Tenacibaculum geojense TaxID=915352 RepID=A0ABW3JP14_9FLAO